MTQVFSYSQLRGGTGLESSNPLENLVNAGRVAACSIYQSAPYQFFDGIYSSAGDVTGITARFQALMDNMCADRPLPPRPVAPPAGGRCPGTTYQVNFRTSSNSGATYTNASINLPGPIGGVTIRRQGAEWSMGWSIGPGNQFSPFYKAIAVGGNPSTQTVSVFRAEILSIVPISGPNNCGSNPPRFPPFEIPPTNFDRVVTYRDRGDDIQVPFRLPPINFPVVVPVKIEPTLNVNIGEININFDLRGANILPVDLTVPITFGGGGGGSSNPLPPVTAPEDDLREVIGDRFDRVDDLLEDIKECACNETGPLETNQIASNVQSVSFSPLSPDRNRYCVVRLTTLPSNRKEQDGGVAPDVVYAGWAWFATPTGDTSERFPVDAVGKIYANTGRFGRFNVSLYDGFRANVFELNTPL